MGPIPDSLARMATLALAAALLAINVGLSQSAIAADSPASSTNARGLSVANKPWTGDFDKMLKRRMIRVLVPYSRTLYFTDKGRERGLTAELVRDFERYVNQKYKRGKRPLTVYLVATTRDKLLPMLQDGFGDIAAGNLTITEERLKQVDFVVQTDRKPVKELVVLGAKAPTVRSFDDLAGLTAPVRKTSSYYESLVALNERLRHEGKSEITLQLVPDALEDEDIWRWRTPA